MTAKHAVMAALALSGCAAVTPAGTAAGTTAGDPCPDQVQPGRWVKMAGQPGARSDAAWQSEWAGRRVLTALGDGRILILPRNGNHMLGGWMALLDPATAQVTRADIPAALQNRRSTQAVVAGRRLLVFGGFRDLPLDDCKGLYPCDRAGPAAQVTPDGMIYGL